MSDKKITALTALAGASTASTDVFPVVDVSATETKKITRAELAVAVAVQGLDAGSGNRVSIHGVYLPYHGGTSHTIAFEGSTDDEYETVLTVANPTADRTITLPDETGTVATQAYADTAAATAVAGVSTDFSDSDNILANSVFS